MGNVNISINGNPLSATEGCTVLDVAKEAGIRIPTLCFMKGLDPRANCRMCIVEIEGYRTFQPSCITKVSEGMVIHTDTPAIQQSRKTTLQLILSHHAVDCHHCLRIGSSRCDDLDPTFCEMCFFCDCVRDGFCELQALAREYKVDVLPYDWKSEMYPMDDSTGSVVRNPSKCIKCRRCVDVCNDVQTVNALSFIKRGSEAQVMPALGKPLADGPCVQCGKCIEVCPTGAIYAHEKIDEILYVLHLSYDITTIAQISVDVLEELATLFKMDPVELDLRVVAAGLRKIGVDYVVTDEFATTQAENSAISDFTNTVMTGRYPAIVSNRFSSIKFLKKNFNSLSDSLFVYNSVQQEFGTIVKSTWAKEKGINPEQIRTISITSNYENNAEAAESGGVDFVINPRQLYRIFLRSGVNLNNYPPTDFDDFGSITSSSSQLKNVFTPAICWEIGNDIKEIEFIVGSSVIKAAVAKNLGQARQLLRQLRNGESPYMVIKI